MSRSQNFASSHWSTSLKIGLTVAPILLGVSQADAQQNKGTDLSREQIYSQSLNVSALTKISSPKDLVSKFSTESNLYIQGNIGVADSTLKNLNTWINTSHPNWFVILVERSEGSSWQSSSGESFNNDRAYEYAVAYGLKEKGYESPINPKTQQPYEAFMIITFDKNDEYRTVKFNGGPTFDNNGLDGDRHWEGNLDQLAIEPLKDGRDVIRAVKNTVTGIESRLANTLTNQEAEAKRLLNEAKNLHSNNELQKQRLELEVEKFKISHPGAAQGSLAQIDYVAINTSIKAAGDSLEEGRIKDSRNISTQVQSTIRNHLEEIVQYESSGQQIKQYEQKIEALKKHPYSLSDAAGIAQIDKQYKLALEKWAQGQKGYDTDLRAFERGFEKTKLNIQNEQNLAEAKSTAAKGGGAAILLIAGALGVVGNRRASAAREKFNKKLAVVEQALAEKESQLMELDTNVARLLDNTNFTGESKEQDNALRREIPELFIMITSAREVVSRAKNKASTGIRRTFDPKSYEDAINILDDSPVEFSDSSDLGAALGKDNFKSKSLWAELSSFEPFQSSMTEILTKFNTIAQTAQGRLDRLEHAQISAEESYQEITKLLADSSTILTEVASTDGLRLKESEKKIDGFENQQAELRKLLLVDPVTGSQVAATQKNSIEKGLSELKNALDGFQEVATTIDTVAKTGSKIKVPLPWIDDEKKNIDLIMDNVISDILDGQVIEGENIVEITDSSASFLNGVKSALTAIEASEVEIQTRLTEIAKARTIIADTLNIKESSVFIEQNHNPIEVIEQAQQKIGSIRRSISERNLENAKMQLEEYNAKLLEVDSIVSESLKVLSLFESKRSDSENESLKIQGQIQDTNGILKEILSKYSGKSLLLDVTEYADKQSNPQLEDNIIEIQKALDEASKARAEGLVLFKAGNLLQGRFEISRSELLNQIAQGRIDEVKERDKLLEELKISVEKRFEACTLANEQFNSDSTDSRTTSATQQAISQYAKAREELEKIQAQEIPDLIDISIILSNLEENQRVVSSAIRNDRDAHQEAVRSLSVSRQALETLGSLSAKAKADQAGDSQELTREIQQIRDFSVALESLEKSLQVDHSDWIKLDAQIDSLTIEMNQSTQRMNNELAEANTAIKALGEGKSWISRAASWSGNYGISISTSSAKAHLDSAYQLLQNGRYQEAIKEAELAQRRARSEISEGDEAVRREKKKRDDARRAAEAAESARRAAAYRSSRSSSSSSSSWSSGSGFGSSSHSSGSGFGSSKW